MQQYNLSFFQSVRKHLIHNDAFSHFLIVVTMIKRALSPFHR